MQLGKPHFSQANTVLFDVNDRTPLPVTYHGASFDSHGARYELYVCGRVVFARYGDSWGARFVSTSLLSPLTDLSGPVRIRAEQLLRETQQKPGCGWMP